MSIISLTWKWIYAILRGHLFCWQFFCKTTQTNFVEYWLLFLFFNRTPHNTLPSHGIQILRRSCWRISWTRITMNVSQHVYSNVTTCWGQMSFWNWPGSIISWISPCHTWYRSWENTQLRYVLHLHAMHVTLCVLRFCFELYLEFFLIISNYDKKFFAGW